MQGARSPPGPLGEQLGCPTVSFFLGIPLGSLTPLAPESLAVTGEDAGSILPPVALGPRLLQSYLGSWCETR